jgi:hypothetical protein
MDEALFYLIGFWRFVFSSAFRKRWLAEFRAKKDSGKLFWVFDGIIASVIGLGLLGIFLFAIYGRINLALSIDKCLDSGGSFNHEARTCQKE